MKTLTLVGLAAVLTIGASASAMAAPQQRPYGDRDRDGIPNAYDNRNNNRGPGGDRDHDGVPNAFDANDRWDSRWGREVRPPRHWGNRGGWNRHVRACFARYRSYNPRTDSYLVRRNVWARCRL